MTRIVIVWREYCPYATFQQIRQHHTLWTFWKRWNLNKIERENLGTSRILRENNYLKIQIKKLEHFAEIKGLIIWNAFTWHLWIRRCAYSNGVALWQLHFQYGDESGRNRQIFTEHSVKVEQFLSPLTIGKCNFIYSACLKVFFVRICRVFYGSQGQT